MQRKIVLVAIACAVALGALAGWIAHEKSQPITVRLADIERIDIHPVPEGPVPPPFVRRPTGSGERPLASLSGSIPIPLPHPVWQGFACSFGGTMTITLSDGTRIAYGPCRRPPS